MALSTRAICLTLAVALIGCGTEESPTGPGLPPVAVAPAIGALIDGRAVQYRAYEGESQFIDWLGLEEITIVGIHSGSNGPGLLQIELWHFDGAGTYVLDGNGSSHGGWGIYDRDTLPGHSYWSYNTPGDTAWVDYYDPATGEIEGRFSFTGLGTNDSVKVTGGNFRGHLERRDPFLLGPLAAAQVNGRLLAVDPADAPDNGLTQIGGTDGMGGTVVLIAYHPEGGGGEGMQLWLDGFSGVGAYPISDAGYVPGGAWAAYWSDDSVGVRTGFWGRGHPGDTAWVRSYDPVSRRIEGEFQFLAGDAPDTVRIQHGVFHGTVRDYVPGGSAGQAPSRPGIGPRR